MTDRPQEDQGFTLIELLISVTIMLIVISALSGALVTFLVNGTYTTQRDDHSGGAAVLSNYLNRDLASADAVGGTPCASGSALDLSWTEYTASAADPTPVLGDVHRVSYVLEADADDGSKQQLVRVACPPSGAAQRAVLLRGMPAGALVAHAVVKPASDPLCPGPDKALEVRLAHYGSDQAEQGYSYLGCLEGRRS